MIKQQTPIRLIEVGCGCRKDLFDLSSLVEFFDSEHSAELIGYKQDPLLDMDNIEV